MTNDNMVDPILKLGDNKWFFVDETWSSHYGPFDTELEARAKLKQYSEGVNQPSIAEVNDDDGDDFWEQQFTEAKAGEYIPEMATEEQREAAWNLKPKEMPKAVLPLETVGDLYKLEGLIDGGYLSFIYGSRKNNLGGWHGVKMKYANYLLVQDSGGVRKDEYPLYKSRRNERRGQYDYMAQTYERVKQFREILSLDPLVNTAKIEGYEADDIIALLFMKGIGQKSVIAQDKDFFMVEGLRQVMSDHNGIPQGQRGLKLPKYAIEPNNPASWALTQAIFGDKSDSIPRLLPSKTGYREVYNSTVRQAPDMLTALYNCAAEFGDQFEINLRLVLLPHPTLSNQDYNITFLLFDDVASGRFWHPDNYDDGILEEVIKSVKDRKSLIW